MSSAAPEPPDDPAEPPPQAGGSAAAAAGELVPLLYEELRRIARSQLRREREGHTLNTTDLVHEAYFRLAEPSNLNPTDRARFLAAAAVAMRRVLIDHAREHQAEKRGGRRVRVSLTRLELPIDTPADSLLALDDSLNALALKRPRLASVVQCRYFGGMTEEETAAALGVTTRTIQRDWAKARAWLAQDLGSSWTEGDGAQ